MKKIAFFTDSWKRLVTYSWNIGIARQLNNYSEPVSLFQFNSFGNWSSDKAYNQGEYNIYNLPDLSTYDGVLVDVTNIIDMEVLDDLTRKVKAANIPAVSLGKQLEGFYYVGIDNENTITELLNHMYDVHDCRRYVYVGGPIDNCDNIEREAAYREFIRAKGMDIDANPVWNGGFTYENGQNSFKRIMDQGMQIPDVIICGNDYIAAGAIMKAKEYGYECPRDFYVTGFDNIYQANFFKPHITTIEQKRDDIGEMGIRLLYDIWDGKKPEKINHINNQCVYSESCGCANEDHANYNKFVNDTWDNNEKNTLFEEALANFQIKLSTTHSFGQILDATKAYMSTRDCGGFAMVLDRRLLSVEPVTEFAEAGYSYPDLEVALCLENGREVENCTIAYLKERFARENSCDEYLFSALHFEEKSIGYVIMKNGSFLFDNPYYCNMQLFLTQALLRVYHTEELANENNKLDNLYKHDQLTGVYNRIAFGMYAEDFLKGLQKVESASAFVFIDADEFKMINDTYGHDKGDKVLVEIAHAITDECPRRGMVFRYGGDEFIAIFGCENREEADDFSLRVNRRLKQFDISVSMGIVYNKPNEERCLMDCVKLADQYMYEIKRNKKQ